jgi:hypothetical protein
MAGEQQSVTMATRHESSRTQRVSEATDVHTRILRLALGIEESRSYWEHIDPTVPVADRALLAFEQRWFGSKSLERVRFLLANLGDRYDGYPEALGVLCRWRSMEASERQVICHWHLQLSDPLYRRFTGQFLVERRALRDPKLDRAITLRWVKSEFPDRWSEATCVQFASKLLSAASEAGLLSPKRDPRALLLPKAPDRALAYLMHVLRGLRFAGTLTENPYLASVGLAEGFLDQRLRAMSDLSFRRMGELTEVEWQEPTLTAWAEARL